MSVEINQFNSVIKVLMKKTPGKYKNKRKIKFRYMKMLNQYIRILDFEIEWAEEINDTHTKKLLEEYKNHLNNLELYLNGELSERDFFHGVIGEYLDERIDTFHPNDRSARLFNSVNGPSD